MTQKQIWYSIEHRPTKTTYDDTRRSNYVTTNQPNKVDRRALVLLSALDSQSRPSYTPSPVVAQHACARNKEAKRHRQTDRQTGRQTDRQTRWTNSCFPLVVFLLFFRGTFHEWSTCCSPIGYCRLRGYYGSPVGYCSPILYCSLVR